MEQEATAAEILGDLIRAIRKKAKVNQATVGKYLGYSGGTIISHVESGKREMRLWEFTETCRFLRRNPVEVMNELMKEATGSHIWPSEEDAPKGTTRNKRRQEKRITKKKKRS